MRTLAGLLSQQGAQQRSIGEKTRKLEQMHAERAALADAPAREMEAARQLSKLGDPRREAAQQEVLAAQEQKAREGLKAASQLVARADKELAALEKHLAPFAGLDARIEQLNRDTEQSRVGLSDLSGL